MVLLCILELWIYIFTMLEKFDRGGINILSGNKACIFKNHILTFAFLKRSVRTFLLDLFF